MFFHSNLCRRRVGVGVERPMSMNVVKLHSIIVIDANWVLTNKYMIAGKISMWKKYTS